MRYASGGAGFGLRLLPILALALPGLASADEPAPGKGMAKAAMDVGGEESGVNIPYESFTLDNGLTVLVHEDHSVPIVHTEIWYKVGSQNEKPGLTGFAHLFEHLMFQGSANHDTEYFEPLQQVGASVNGTTNMDRTNYFESLPSTHLDLALWLEADRMGWLLPALTQEKLDNQREVVKNERRQRYENVPYGEARGVIHASVYPEGHPYNWLTIGSQEDLDRASLEEVKDFFRTYYVPNNATLCVAGDVTVEQVKARAERYFGEVPRGADVAQVQAERPMLTEVKRATLEDQVSLPRLYMIWPTPPLYEEGDAALDILSSVLTSGITSRLYKRLVYDMQIAQRVSAFQGSAQLSSLYYIDVTAAPGHTLAEIEAVIDEELAALRKTPPTAEEVQRAKNGWESNFVFGLQDIGSKASTLCSYRNIAGDPNYIQKDLDRYLSVTPEGVTEVVNTYLKPDARFILHVVPEASEGGAQ